jgi:hypothetical protein
MEYALYNGKALYFINGEEGLNATIKMLKNNREARIGMIHLQKVCASVSLSMDEMIKRGYLVREGTKEECEREDRDTDAIRNFSKLLKDTFPEDWQSTIVSMYQGSLPLPQNLECPECYWKLQVRKRVDGYTCRNKKCKNFYHIDNYNIARGVIFKLEEAIPTIVLEPALEPAAQSSA